MTAMVKIATATRSSSSAADTGCPAYSILVCPGAKIVDMLKINRSPPGEE
jgi:hypothetical protein